MDVLFDKFGFSAGVNEVHIMVTNFGLKNERYIILATFNMSNISPLNNYASTYVNVIYI
jgi:hypothetical protein